MTKENKWGVITHPTDIMICNTKDFPGFTYGKSYEGTIENNTFITHNNIGNKQAPCILGSRRKNKKRKAYFLSVDEFRENQLEDLLNS